MLANEAHEDPYRVKLAKAAVARGEEWCREEFGVYARVVDPRADNDPKIQAVGGKTTIDMFAERHQDAQGELEPLFLTPASGLELDRGHTAINDLLRFEPTKPVVRFLNCPRLFVCEDCQQVRWAMENYTGLGGEKGACKDFVDLVRYMAVSDLRYIQPGGTVETRGGMRKRQ